MMQKLKREKKRSTTTYEKRVEQVVLRFVNEAAETQKRLEKMAQKKQRKQFNLPEDLDDDESQIQVKHLYVFPKKMQEYAL